MSKNTFTKIVSTIGPSSEKKIKEILEAGVDVCRVNFSHGDHAEQGAKIKDIKRISKELNRPVAILADLQGPKHRIGCFKDGEIKLKPGQDFKIYLEDKLGDEQGVRLPNPEVFKVLTKGQKILLNDGYVALEVLKAGKDFAETKVLYGDKLSDKKGFNIPNTILDIPILTEKDENDLKFVLTQNVDYLAISFVQTAKDVIEVRSKTDGKLKIISKIEKPSAVEDLENIVKESDGIMVARGDLAVEIGQSKVPSIQRDIISMCQKYGKPVIVATQMMESMIENPSPTRAETSDVATAVYLGADAVMTSAETATGKYPIETVNMMEDIIEDVEHSSNWNKFLNASARSKDVVTLKEAIGLMVAKLAKKINAKAIVCFSITGTLPKIMSSYRIQTPMLCLTRNEEFARQSELFWGVRSVILEEKEDPNYTDFESLAKKYAANYLGLKSGDNIVITLGKRSDENKSVLAGGVPDVVTVSTL